MQQLNPDNRGSLPWLIWSLNRLHPLGPGRRTRHLPVPLRMAPASHQLGACDTLAPNARCVVEQGQISQGYGFAQILQSARVSRQNPFGWHTVTAFCHPLRHTPQQLARVIHTNDQQYHRKASVSRLLDQLKL